MVNRLYFDKHTYLHNELKRLFQELDYNDVLDVFLYGGYSRFDGAILEDGSFYNDVDILIVLKGWFSNYPDKDRLSDKIRKISGLKNIDLMFTNPMKMRLWKKSVFLYDLKYKGFLIYGSGESLEYIRPVLAADLPYLKEAYIQASTRAYCILKPMLMFSLGPLTEKELLFVNYQFAKLVISCVDSELLFRGEYQCDLHEKILALQKLNNSSGLLDLSIWAVNFKKHPRIENIFSSSFEESIIFYDLYIERYQALFKIASRMSFRDLFSSKSRKNRKIAKFQFRILQALGANEFNLESIARIENFNTLIDIILPKQTVKLSEALISAVQVREKT